MTNPNPSAGECVQRALVAFYRDAEYDCDGHITNGEACMTAALAAAPAPVAAEGGLSPAEVTEVEALYQRSKFDNTIIVGSEIRFLVGLIRRLAARLAPSAAPVWPQDRLTDHENDQLQRGLNGEGDARFLAHLALRLVNRLHGTLATPTAGKPEAGAGQVPAEHVLNPDASDFERGFQCGFNRLRDRWLAALHPAPASGGEAVAELQAVKLVVAQRLDTETAKSLIVRINTAIAALAPKENDRG